MTPGVTIYTDGACSGNPGPGGWGAILMHGTTEKELSGGELATTNNRMELMAAIRGLEALTKLRPFIHVARLQNSVVGYVTIERDGPVPGAAYMRNIVVNPSLRRKGVGALLLGHALQISRDMYRKTLALRVDPANAPAVSFYRKEGFTTVATVVSRCGARASS